MTAEMEKRKRMAVFSGSSNLKLADEIAQELGISLGNVKLEKFANGEIYARYQESVRGADVFIVQSVCSSPNGFDVNDNLTGHLRMKLDADRGLAEILYRSVKKYLSLIDNYPELTLKRVRDLLRRHRTVNAAVSTNLILELQSNALKLRRDILSVLKLNRLTVLLRLLAPLYLIQRLIVRDNRKPARKQKIARVSVRHVNKLSFFALGLYVLCKYYLHF